MEKSETSRVEDDSGFVSFTGRHSGETNGHRETNATTGGDRIPESGDEDVRAGNMTDTDKVSMKVSMLSRDNYARWRIEIEDVLAGHGLWSYASGEEQVVVKPAADDRELAVKLKKYQEWHKNDSKAKSVIRRTLDDTTFNHVVDCVSSHAILERIKTLRDPKTTDVLMTSITSFFEERFREEDDVTSFLARLAVTSAKVNGCENKDVKLTDQFIVGKTLASLPARFSSFKSSWYMLAKNDSKLEEFREKLLTSEQEIMSQDKQAGTSAAADHDVGDALHVGKSKQRRFKNKNKTPAAGGKKFTGDCFHCGKPGHMKSECFKLKGSGSGTSDAGSGKRHESANTAFAARASSSIIADCGASRHITGNKNWFKELRRLDDPIPLSTASGDIRATHVGTIVVQVTSDGKNWHKRDWSDVLLVPGLDTNLFSTTWMERDGYSFSHGNGTASLSRKGKRVIRATWGGSSYLMDMKVVSPKDQAMVVKSLELWHSDM